MRNVFFAALLLFAASGIACAEPVPPHSIDVVDGDTIDFQGERWRLVGFDTPETKSRARCEAERTRGAEASRRLRLIIAGGAIDLQRIACACRPGTEGTMACNHGRLCAVLRAGGRDVGEILISERLARPYICKDTHCPPRGDWCGSL